MLDDCSQTCLVPFGAKHLKEVDEGGPERHDEGQDVGQDRQALCGVHEGVDQEPQGLSGQDNGERQGQGCHFPRPSMYGIVTVTFLLPHNDPTRC